MGRTAVAFATGLVLALLAASLPGRAEEGEDLVDVFPDAGTTRLERLLPEVAEATGRSILLDPTLPRTSPLEIAVTGGLAVPRERLFDTYRSVDPDPSGDGTFGGFEGDSSGAKIDFVFARGPWRVAAADILRRRRGDRDPSDHFPVTAELVLEGR